MSHHTWQSAYGGDPAIVGSNVGDRRSSVHRDRRRRPPDSSARRCAAIRRTSAFRSSMEPLINGDSALLHQPVSAWLRAIGRLRPGATTAGMAPRLTAVLRHWMQHDSGYPANWMPDVDALVAEADVDRRARRRRCWRDEGRVRAESADSAGGLRSGAAHRLRQCREPAARAIGRAADANGGSARRRRLARADHHAGACRKRAARRARRRRRAGRRDGRGAAAARRWPSPVRSSCRSAPSPRCSCSRLRSVWR